MAMIDVLIKKKNSIIMGIESAKADGDDHLAFSLSLEAAQLEEQIGDALIAEGALEDAVINLVSAGSCFLGAGEKGAAKKVLKRAWATTRIESVRIMVQEQLRLLCSRRRYEGKRKPSKPSWGRRRTFLIDKELRCGLSSQESEELQAIQDKCSLWLKRVCPRTERCSRCHGWACLNPRGVCDCCEQVG